MKLHISQLIDKNACQSQVDLFRSKFGDSVDVTPELCASVAAEFYFAWIAYYLLSPSALDEYRGALALARAQYPRATCAECQRAIAIAFAIAYNTMEVQS